ncbi:MAG: hypothetical protein ABH885_06545 [Candidatus Omnitrophota bacterium]
MIRPMRSGDIGQVVRLYAGHMYESSFIRFGEEFLVVMFRAMLDSGLGINYIFEEEGGIKGYISASADTGRLFREIIVKRAMRLIKAVLPEVARHPSLIKDVIEACLYFRKAGLSDIKAEFLFITIDPACRGRDVSKDLINEVIKEFSRRGVKKAKVTALKNNHVVSNLLADMRFRQMGAFKFYGKETLIYERKI